MTITDALKASVIVIIFKKNKKHLNQGRGAI